MGEDWQFSEGSIDNMKVLLVSNEYSKPGRIGNPILTRILEALKSNEKVEDVEFVPFTNSLRCFGDIRRSAKRADVIHIQFGGLYAFLIWFCLIGINKPKYLTFHGTDIHAKEIKTTKSFLIKLKIWLNQKASFCSILMFDKVGFVSDSLLNYIPKWIARKYKEKMFIQPLGVDYTVFVPLDKSIACETLGIECKNYCLFSDKSSTKIKRRDIAQAIVNKMDNNYSLLIMSGVDPALVPFYINACDFLLLTSDEEGSPNIVREALSLNKRVFSVDVGDVKKQLEGLNDSEIISRVPEVAADVIIKKLELPYTDNTRVRLKDKIDFKLIVNNLVDLYEQSLMKNTSTLKK